MVKSETTDLTTPVCCETCRWADPAKFPPPNEAELFVCKVRLPPMLRRAAKMQSIYVRADEWCALHA